MTTVTIYQNNRNGNKFLEVRNDGHYHNSVRQFMHWHSKSRISESDITNYAGDGRFHRWKIGNLRALLEDYHAIGTI